MAIRREEFRIKPIDSEKDVAIGVKLPFSTKQGGLFELSYTTEDQAISNLKSLLLTKKGERPMRPNFGTGIWQRLFEKKGPEFNILLEKDLRQDIGFWLPYIILDKLIVEDYNEVITSMQEHGSSITIQFRVTEQGANRTITLNVDSSSTLSVS